MKLQTSQEATSTSEIALRATQDALHETKLKMREADEDARRKMEGAQAEWAAEKRAIEERAEKQIAALKECIDNHIR